MPKTQFYLLKTRRLLPLFITQFLGAFNDNVFKSALVMLITFHLVQHTSHAQLLINLAGGIFILPFFLFSAFAGQLADKFDRIKLINIIKFLEILFMIIGGLGFYFGNITLLMITLFLMGTHSTFFGPIKYSALPDLLQAGEILGGNGLVSASTFIAILLGTIIGTELGITTQGAVTTSMIAVIMAIIGWLTSFYIPKIPIAAPQLKINFNFLQEIGILIRQTRQNKIVFFVILEISWFWYMGFIFVTQFPVYVKTIIGGDENVVTLFLVMFSVGIAIGSLLCNRALKGAIHAKYVPLGTLGMTLFTLDLCWASSGGNIPIIAHSGGLSAFINNMTAVRIALDLLLLAIAGGFYIVPLYSILQTKCEPENRSRMIASNNILGALFMVAAAVCAIVILGIGLTTVHLFLITGLLNSLVALIAWKKMPALEP